MNTFAESQQAVDTVLGHYDELRLNGKDFHDAASHIMHRFGVRYDRLADLVTRRSLRQIGDSGSTEYFAPDTGRRS